MQEKIGKFGARKSTGPLKGSNWLLRCEIKSSKGRKNELSFYYGYGETVN